MKDCNLSHRLLVGGGDWADGAVVGDAAVGDNNRAVAKLTGKIHVMSGDDTGMLKSTNYAADLTARLKIKFGRRLVEDENARLHRQHRSDSNTFFLTARQAQRRPLA